MPVEITDFGEEERKSSAIEEFPVIELNRFNVIDKNKIPENGLVARIDKVLRVRTRYGDRYLLQTNRGDVWIPWSELKKLASAWGTATRDWQGKNVLIKTALVKVGGELKKTVILDPM